MRTFCSVLFSCFSEENFRLLTENIHGGFWIMGPEARTIHYISPGFKPIFGFDPEEVYEKPQLFMKAVHPEDRKRVMTAFTGLSYGIDFHEEWRILLPSLDPACNTLGPS